MEHTHPSLGSLNIFLLNYLCRAGYLGEATSLNDCTNRLANRYDGNTVRKSLLIYVLSIQKYLIYIL